MISLTNQWNAKLYIALLNKETYFEDFPEKH